MEEYIFLVKEIDLATNKHLVLDADVHKALKEKRRRVGLTIREIGNSILRAVLSHPFRSEVIGKKLIEKGMVTPEEFTDLMTEVIGETTGLAIPYAELVEITPSRTLVSGNWESRELFVARDGSFELLEGWVRKGEHAQVKPHYHNQSEFTFVLNGEIEIETDLGKRKLEALESVLIPPMVMHSTTPITSNARILITNVPSWSEFMQADPQAKRADRIRKG